MSINTTDEVQMCQAHKRCGYRACRKYRGYWLCLKSCYRSRKRIYTNIKDLERYVEEK